MSKLKYIYVCMACALAILLSCGRSSSEKTFCLDAAVFLQIDNDALKKELLAYDSLAQGELRNGHYLVNTYFKDVNDSITQFVVTVDTHTLNWNSMPFNFVCKIKSKYFLFTSMELYGSNSPFSIQTGAKEEILKEYFPSEYADYKRKLYRPYRNNMPNLYLTFCKGRLVAKELRRGLITDPQKYRLQ